MFFHAIQIDQNLPFFSVENEKCCYTQGQTSDEELSVQRQKQ